MTNQNYTHLLLIADRSGSMYAIADDMNNGIKQFLDDQEKLPGKILVDVATFDNRVELISRSAKPSEVKHPVIYPRGGTALLDAIGESVTVLGQAFAALPEDERPGKVIVVIVTDGQENSSREWQQAKVKALVKRQEDSYSWDFIFLGANIDSAAVGAGFGVARASTMTYSPDAFGASAVAGAMSNYVTARRGGDSTSTLADLQAPPK